MQSYWPRFIIIGVTDVTGIALWLAGTGGSAAVAAPVTMTADALAATAKRRFRQFRRTDDLSRLVKVATGTTGLTRRELDAVARLLQDADTWRLLGHGAPEDMVQKIAVCLREANGPAARDPVPVAGVITRALLEFTVADLQPKLFQQVLLTRIQRLETNQASVLDEALLRQQAGLSAFLADHGQIDAELVARLMRQLDKMLDRLPPGPADRDGIAAYLRALIGLLSKDPWPQHRRFGHAPLAPPAIERKLDITPSTFSGQRQKVQPADHMAKRCQRLVILGGPGSGKTWLAKRIARRSAQQALAALAAGAALDEVEVPIYTTCSRLLAAQGDIRAAVVASALSQIGDMGGSRISSAVGAFLAERNEPTLLVIDSLDEARGSDERLRQADTLPWRIVLTSRPTSWDHQLAIHPDKPKVHCVGELQPLQYPDDVDSFIRRWFAAQPEHGTTLSAQIARRPTLQQAVTVPLILALYCVVGGGGEPLPEFRLELYDRVVACLLTSQWRGGGGEPQVDLCLRKLTDWAWASAVNHPVSGIGAWEDDVLTGYERLNQADGEALDNVAMPLGPPSLDDGTVQRRFIHRSVREHLVARHIANFPVDEAANLLLPHLWYDADWEQTVADAIVMHPHRDLLVHHLIHSADSHNSADEVAAIDVGGEFQALLTRLAAESGEGDWQSEIASMISRARVEIALYAPPGRLSPAPHWPSSAQSAREMLLRRIVGAPLFREDPGKVATALIQLDPTPEERHQAIGELLMCLPSLPKHFTDPYFSLPVGNALADIAQTSDERRQVREAMLNIFAGPLSEARAVFANAAIDWVVKITETPDERRHARETLLSFVTRPNGSIQAKPWLQLLLRLGARNKDKRQAREALLNLMANQPRTLSREWEIAQLAGALIRLDPTDEDKQRARETLLDLMTAEASDWRVSQLAAVLLRLDPSDEENRLARNLAPAETDYWKPKAMARTLLRLDPDQGKQREARMKLLDEIAAESSGGNIGELASALVRLAATAAEKRRARQVLLDTITTHGSSEAVAELASALARLDPTPDEKRRGCLALLERMTAETRSRDSLKLARALVLLDPVDGDKQRGREALLSKIAAETSKWDVKDLASALVELAATADEEHQTRQALLDAMIGHRSNEAIAELATTLVQLGPTPDEKRHARRVLCRKIASERSRYEADSITGALAQLDPTMADIRSWPFWSLPPNRALLEAVRSTSTPNEWLAALADLPGLKDLR